jgi:hypothetical protein
MWDTQSGGLSHQTVTALLMHELPVSRYGIGYRPKAAVPEFLSPSRDRLFRS